VTGEADARWIDVTELPEAVVALVDALGAGDELLIIREGKAIATVSGTFTGMTDPVRAADSSGDRWSDTDDVTVVVTAMKLSASARSSLSAQLGPDYIVLDMHSAHPASVDVLLTPPVSPQLIENFRMMYPKARVVITEIEDKELGVSYLGPVRRLLNAGAHTYLPPATIPRMARQLDRTMTQLRQLTTGAAASPLMIESPNDDDEPAAE
jgi:hypothetical protein